MDSTEQKEVLKKLKTGRKFLKIVSTIFLNASNKILETDNDNDFAKLLMLKHRQIDGILGSYDDSVIEAFKADQKMPGYQLELEF